MDEEMLTVAEAAERLKINPETVRVWIRSEKLKAVMPGGDRMGYRIPASEIRRVLGGPREPSSGSSRAA